MFLQYHTAFNQQIIAVIFLLKLLKTFPNLKFKTCFFFPSCIQTGYQSSHTLKFYTHEKKLYKKKCKSLTNEYYITYIEKNHSFYTIFLIGKNNTECFFLYFNTRILFRVYIRKLYHVLAHN